MSIGLKPKSKKTTMAKAPKKTSRAMAQEPVREIEPLVAHVVGKPAEVEPVEHAVTSTEEPEAAMQSAEAPDAGYGRCTESSDWENRGRS